MTKEYNERNYSIHPSTIMMVLILAGVTLLFAALSFAYIYTRIDKDMQSVRTPWLFFFNTLLLLSSSICIEKSRKYFDVKNGPRAIRYGLLTIGVTLAFLVLQFVAWKQLFSQSLFPSSGNGYGYLYAISILHFLHVLAGLPFLLRILVPLHVAIQQGNEALIFLQEPIRRKWKHTSWYWHFLDIVWIYLVLFFMINLLW